MASLLSTPELFNSWSCSGGTSVLELLLLSCQMKDGVLETGREQVPLPFALLLPPQQAASVCMFIFNLTSAGVVTKI